MSNSRMVMLVQGVTNMWKMLNIMTKNVQSKITVIPVLLRVFAESPDQVNEIYQFRG